MPTLSYRQIPAALERLDGFRGNSMSAEWTDPERVTLGRLEGDDREVVAATLRRAARYGEQVYVVYSRITPIALVTRDGATFHVRQRFSVTTSRQQGLARTYLQVRPAA